MSDDAVKKLLESAELGAATGATLIPQGISQPLSVMMKVITARPEFEAVFIGKLREIASAGVQAHNMLLVIEQVLGRPTTPSEWEELLPGGKGVKP